MAEPKFDDECVICGTTRDHHGDRHHKFSMDGQLIEVESGPDPRMKPPRTRSEAAAADAEKAAKQAQDPNFSLAFATLIEVLAEKQLLDSKDIIRIFSGRG